MLGQRLIAKARDIVPAKVRDIVPANIVLA